MKKIPINQILNDILTYVQYLLPQHFLSRIIHKLTRMRYPSGKNFLIQQFVRHYQINLEEAQNSDLRSYPDFQSFFIRRLRQELRPIESVPNAIISPVDGEISAMGNISAAMIFQAKGKSYSLETLLGGDSKHTERFSGGNFLTLYLAPRDYHRVHLPIAGRLREMIYLPGRLFSVNHYSVNLIPNLFTKNERVVTIFDTVVGPMALILVGALFVGSIATVWAGEITPSRKRSREIWTYPEIGSDAVTLGKGAEMGYFNMGSTVILLFANGAVAWDENLMLGKKIRMGELIGTQCGIYGP